MSKENVETVRRSLDAWLQSPHPEIEFISALARQVEGDETVWRGPAELRRFSDEWHSVWNLSTCAAAWRCRSARL